MSEEGTAPSPFPGHTQVTQESSLEDRQDVPPARPLTGCATLSGDLVSLSRSLLTYETAVLAVSPLGD